MINNLTQKELAHRWGVSYRSVLRHVRKYGLQAAAYVGSQPVFNPEAVRRMEARRKTYLEKLARVKSRNASKQHRRAA